MAFGLRVLQHDMQADYTAAVHRYNVRADDSTALFIGDPVKRDSGSLATSAGISNVVRAGATDPLKGVVEAVVLAGDDLAINYRRASTQRELLVVDNKDVILVCQEDADGGALAVTDVTKYIDLNMASGSVYTGLSGVMLDSSDVNASAGSLNLQLMGIDNKSLQLPDTKAVWKVRIHTFEE